jgi:hypothetical protein
MADLAAALSLEDGLGFGSTSTSPGGVYVSASRALLEKKKQQKLENGKAPENIDLSKSVRSEQKNALLDQVVENFNKKDRFEANTSFITNGFKKKNNEGKMSRKQKQRQQKAQSRGENYASSGGKMKQNKRKERMQRLKKMY